MRWVRPICLHGRARSAADLVLTLVAAAGLGKTLEVISLILLNPCDPGSLDEPYASKLDVTVKPTKATLIVAPPILTQQ